MDTKKLIISAVTIGAVFLVGLTLFTFTVMASTGYGLAGFMMNGRANNAQMMGNAQQGMMGRGQMMGKAQQGMMGRGQMMGNAQQGMMGRGQMMGKAQQGMMGRGQMMGNAQGMMGRGQMMGQGQGFVDSNGDGVCDHQGQVGQNWNNQSSNQNWGRRWQNNPATGNESTSPTNPNSDQTLPVTN